MLERKKPLRRKARRPSLAVKQEIARRYANEAISYSQLAKIYDISYDTVRKICKDFNVRRTSEEDWEKFKTIDKRYKAFTKKIRHLLFLQWDDGDKIAFSAFERRVKALMRNGYTHEQATVEMCKTNPVLKPLIKEFEMEELDINKQFHPESSPKHDDLDLAVTIEEKEGTLRSDLDWAVNAAGENLRTGKEPLVCPNNRAYFLYRQAKDDPKNFTQKLTLVESKVKKEVEGEESKEIKKSSKEKIKDIDELLESFSPDGDN